MRGNHIGRATVLFGALGLAILLAACGSKSSSSDTTGSITPLTALSDSGAQRALHGVWTSCDPSTNTREILTILGTNAADIQYTGTAGVTCTGGTPGTPASLTFATLGPFSMSGSVGSTGPSTATGWINGVTGAPLSPPAKASGVGTLAAHPVVTQFMISGTFAGTHSFFFDDSTARYRLYASTQGGAYCPLVNGNEVCLGGDVYLQASAPLVVQGASGAMVSMDGTWIGCEASAGLNTGEWQQKVFSGSSLTINTYTGAAAAACTGGTLDPTRSGSVTIGPIVTTLSAANWTDGSSSAAVTGPNSVSPGTALPGPFPATIFTISGTIGSSVLTEVQQLAFVDDTGTPMRAYKSDHASTGVCAVDGSGNDVCFNAHYDTK